MPKRKPKDPLRSADMPHEWIARHLDQVARFVYYDPLDIPQWEYRRSQLVAEGEYQDIDSDWGTITLGEQWGGADVTGFFRTTLDIPQSHATPDAMLDIFLDGGEAQLIINGHAWQGLDWNRSLVPLGDLTTKNQQLNIEIEAFIINYPYDERRHDEREFHTFERARLLKRDPELEAFVLEARFLLETYLSYWRSDDNLEIEDYLLHHLEAMARLLGTGINSRELARERVALAHPYLRENLFESAVYQQHGSTNLAAHSHLDIVYLWRLKETLRKNCRTITNMLSLMREYPDYEFSYSQPYLYQKLKEMYPAVYEEMRQRILEGRWEVVGAMYLEPDGNLVGAESLVRHLLFGKQFIQDEFGLDAQTCWLPDVFGLIYTLPQILQKAGVKYFLTAKLNIWNDTTVFPHDTFRWRGPDGSEVLTHFPPTHFAQELSPDNLRRNWADFRERNTVGENIFIYGYGDGGGGPTREMVAISNQLQGIPGLPNAKIDKIEDYFARLEPLADTLPVWDDELYLEAHRGTYTSKADLKWQNRKGEMLYRDVEILSSFASIFGGAFIQEALNEGWKYLMFNQFHDILPGSHRNETVPDIKRDYDEAFRIANEIRTQTIDYLVSHIDQTEPSDFVIFNTLGWQRNNLVQIPYSPDQHAVRFANDATSPVQHFDDKSWICMTDCPSLGWTTAHFEETTDETRTVTQEGDTIQTLFYEITLNEAGHISRLYDRQNAREVLSDAGNVFQVFEDNPGRKFSAWDIAYHFEEYQHPVTQTSGWELVSNGALFAVFRSEWQVLNSTIQQEMWLYTHTPRIDFHTSVDWRDQQKLLKVAFPLKVRSRTATYDLPFGSIERPTHRNTAYDQARFEVCGHKWADISEGNYGVALLNDSKYGYDAHENVLRLSLMRSPIRPDDKSDLGTHEFSYALLPHVGNWRQGQVDRRAYEFNIPLIATALPEKNDDATMPATYQFLEVESYSVIVEALKQAEDGNGLILRAFDSHGNHGQVAYQFAQSIAEITETDLLEKPLSDESDTDTDHATVDFTPYEIKTHRLV